MRRLHEYLHTNRIAHTVCQERGGNSFPIPPLTWVAHGPDGEVYFEVTMSDAWVWDMYRTARFVKNVKVLTFKDVNIEELAQPDLQVPQD